RTSASGTLAKIGRVFSAVLKLVRSLLVIRSMLRSLFSVFVLVVLAIVTASAQYTPGLVGYIDDVTYVAPGGIYRVKIPVIPELGGTVSDTNNVAVFRDDYTVHVSIGAFPLDATQRWELATRGPKAYLPA